MSTRARILATIGAAWVTVLIVATLVIAANPHTESYLPAPVPGQLTLRGTRDVFAWGTWWVVAAVVTVLAVAAVAVALAWTGRRHD